MNVKQKRQKYFNILIKLINTNYLSDKRFRDLRDLLLYFLDIYGSSTNSFEIEKITGLDYSRTYTIKNRFHQKLKKVIKENDQYSNYWTEAELQERIKKDKEVQNEKKESPKVVLDKSFEGNP